MGRAGDRTERRNRAGPGSQGRTAAAAPRSASPAMPAGPMADRTGSRVARRRGCTWGSPAVAERGRAPTGTWVPAAGSTGGSAVLAAVVGTHGPAAAVGTHGPAAAAGRQGPRAPRTADRRRASAGREPAERAPASGRPDQGAGRPGRPGAGEPATREPTQVRRARRRLVAEQGPRSARSVSAGPAAPPESAMTPWQVAAARVDQSMPEWPNPPSGKAEGSRQAATAARAEIPVAGGSRCPAY
jgi:hypothetical protein